MTTRLPFHRVADWALRLALFGVFATAGSLKLLDPSGFATQVMSYDLLPAYSNYVAMTVPGVEIVAAFTLLAAPQLWRRASCLLICLMLGAFTTAVVWAWAFGVQADCGCFGENSAEIGIEPVVRNLALLAAAGGWLWLDRKKGRIA